MKIGTLISTFATPIAGVLGADCYDPITKDLKPDSPCGKTRARLDAAQNPKEFASAIFDRFRSNKQKGDNMAEETEKGNYLLVVVVQAADAVEALQKKNEGKVLAVNPQPVRPNVQTGPGNVAQPSKTGQTIIRGGAAQQSS